MPKSNVYMPEWPVKSTDQKIYASSVLLFETEVVVIKQFKTESIHLAK